MAFSSKSRTRDLGDGYVAEVDSVDELNWVDVLDRFEDANIYQTWSYDESRFGRKNISHLLLKRGGEVVAAAQARIVKLPFIKAGIAYVRWGPLFRTPSNDDQAETFRQAIRALRNEYACQRGLVLRVYPSVFHDDSLGLASILHEEGFSPSAGPTDRTLLLDLRPSLQELREGLRPHWQRYLKVAEKNKLEIIEGTDDKLFEMFIGIYRELVTRKRFLEPNDIEQFRLAQRRLPERFKMKIMLCKSGDTLCAGLICSLIGDTAIYLFGATSGAGLKSRGSYLLHWKFIEWLKQNGFTTYDLNGINPVVNPGTYKFKSDLCGSNGRDVRFLGRFDSCSSFVSSSCVALGEGLRSRIRQHRKAPSQLQKQDTRSPAAVLTPSTD